MTYDVAMRKWVIGAVAVLVVAAGIILAVTHGSKTTSTTTTTAKAVPIAPLSGMPDPTGAAQKRPAMTVKIENTPEARPLWGVDKADVVYEEIVNGGITRLAAMFNSQVPEKIGPIRSVRPTDAFVVWHVGGIFVYSGGAPYAIKAISKAPVKLIDESAAGSAMFRDSAGGRVAPNNLYGVGPGLFAFGGTPTPPPALFTYHATGAAVKGTKVASFTVNFPSEYPVTWTWDAKTNSWDRSIFGEPDITGTNVRLSPTNVIVQWITYKGGVGTLQSVGQLIGSGNAEIFMDGKEIVATWSRASDTSDTIYKDAKGKVITLNPGQTWVELPAVGETVPVTP